jgi:hypothetical protein
VDKIEAPYMPSDITKERIMTFLILSSGITKKSNDFLFLSESEARQGTAPPISHFYAINQYIYSE